MGKEKDLATSKQKVFKICYTCNMLPALSEYIENKNGNKTMMNEGASLMKMCTESEQLDIFEI